MGINETRKRLKFQASFSMFLNSSLENLCIQLNNLAYEICTIYALFSSNSLPMGIDTFAIQPPMGFSPHTFLGFSRYQPRTAAPINPMSKPFFTNPNRLLILIYVYVYADMRHGLIMFSFCAQLCGVYVLQFFVQFFFQFLFFALFAFCGPMPQPLQSLFSSNTNPQIRIK